MIYCRELSIESTRMFRPGERHRERERERETSSYPIAQYDNSWKTSKSESETKMPVMPGSSLYIFLKSVPIIINIRWFMQCVVLSANAAQGGVQSRFLAQLNSDSVDYDAVECLNYVEGIENYAVNGAKNDNVPLPLDTWLRTAPFLFTLTCPPLSSSAQLSTRSCSKNN
jgi:hypothetical protein